MRDLPENKDCGTKDRDSPQELEIGWVTSLFPDPLQSWTQVTE